MHPVYCDSVKPRGGGELVASGHDHSSMAVASPAEVSTHVDVSTEQEPGPSILQVVANGIASEPVFVLVRQQDE